MPTPHLFFGQKVSNTLLEFDKATFADFGIPYNLRAKTNRVAPAGAGGECIFPAIYITTTHYTVSHVYVIPLVDGKALERKRIDLLNPDGGIEKTTVHEIGLSVPLIIGAVERARFAARGTWVQVLIETLYDGVLTFASRLVIESIEAEYEIVRESKPASGVVA